MAHNVSKWSKHRPQSNQKLYIIYSDRQLLTRSRWINEINSKIRKYVAFKYQNIYKIYCDSCDRNVSRI